MSIVLDWTDETQQVIWCKFSGQWTWDDFHDAVSIGQIMAASVNHTVHIVADGLSSGAPPSKLSFKWLERIFAQAPSNVGIVILVSHHGRVKRFLALANRFYDLWNRIFLVSNMHDAQTIFEQHISRQRHFERLIRLLSSGQAETVNQVIEELRTHDWLYSGAIRGINLSKANLVEANLFMADLERSIFKRATMHQANLFKTNLQKTDFWRSDLRSACLIEANLQEADLRQADMRGADLTGADLRGARLSGTNLYGAKLKQAQLDWAHFDETTILPDGTWWTPHVNTWRFCDPHYQGFWHVEGSHIDSDPAHQR